MIIQIIRCQQPHHKYIENQMRMHLNRQHHRQRPMLNYQNGLKRLENKIIHSFS